MKEAKLNSYTAALTAEQAAKLRQILEERGFRFEEKPYALFSARKEKLQVTVYERGPKVLLQGKGLEDFITFTLEPEVLGRAELGYEEELHPERFQPHFGIDEAGKGDFFGPLVVAGVFADKHLARAFREIGVQDSKRITSDAKLRDLAESIRRTGASVALVVLAPPKYNERYRQLGNLNRLLARAHAAVIEKLSERRPDCRVALSDKFANPWVLRRALMERGRRLELRQEVRAESDPAVAAASILARARFLEWLEAGAREFGETTPFPRGASSLVKARALEFVQRHGEDALRRVAKEHFKTFREVLIAAGLADGSCEASHDDPESSEDEETHGAG